MKILPLVLLLLLQVIAVAQPHYDYTRLKKEDLGRGLVAIREDSSTVVLSWRYLASDPREILFNVYKNGLRLNAAPLGGSTMFRDLRAGSHAAKYEVRALLNGKETMDKRGMFQLAANSPVGYLNIVLNRPADGQTPAGDTFSYSPNDASVGDVDGDGEYEIILKWDPSNAHDNSHDGYTGPVLVDCYKMNGEQLWRIDLGKNIRAGAHYTPFLVYDLDGDGRAEVVMRTSDGCIDGSGKMIGSADADYREPGLGKGSSFGRFRRPPQNQGRILKGKEYLTVFSGLSGKALHTTDYLPPRGEPAAWGDTRANRSDRFLACVAYLDGVHASVVMCRGYYTRTVLAAFDFDGKELKNRWVFDSDQPGNEAYAGQGNHNLRVADLDGDGCDEIIYGSCTIDNNGKGLYSTRLGHGDAIHMTQFDPSDPRLQVWACHENKRDGSTFRDAASGKIIFQLPANFDVGRCMAADIDPENPGVEMWSLSSGGIRNINGKLIAADARISVNMAVWWDGDLLRELLDKNEVSKYNWKEQRAEGLARFEGALSNNGTKATPCLQGDILGDWREEVLLRGEDNASLRLYVSGMPTEYRFHTFLQDVPYRLSIANQNVGYNQPTQPGFYFGPDLGKGWFRGFEIK